MIILDGVTELQNVSSRNYFRFKADVAQFVKELLDKSDADPTSTIIIRRAKSAAYCVEIATTGLSEDTLTPGSSEERQTT